MGNCPISHHLPSHAYPQIPIPARPVFSGTGQTDIGKPLHLFVINNEKFSSLKELQTGKKVFLLINNGIHPGEPDGINADVDKSSQQKKQGHLGIDRQDSS